jgi:predicted HicB family RNase H-like nuclease
MHSNDRRPDRFNIRLDGRLRAIVQAAAEASRRSMNAEICHRIEQAFIRAEGARSGQEQVPA